MDQKEVSMKPEAKAELSPKGVRHAVLFIMNVVEKRQRAANFIWDEKKGTLVEATSNKDIEVVFK